MAKQKSSVVNKKAEQELNDKKSEFWGKLVDLENQYSLKVFAMLEYRAGGIVPVIGIGSKKKEVTE
jgi:hypothetical protein